jgi:hypothetical protein
MWFGAHATCPITALSLTTPAVSRDFILGFSAQEHTFAMTRGSRVCDRMFFSRVTLTARPISASSIRFCLPNISSVTIDHDELCDLPVGRRVA